MNAAVTPTGVLMKIKRPSGAEYVYDVQPQHVPREDIPDSMFWPSEYGYQIAHSLHGVWYERGGWVRITDEGRIAGFESITNIH